MNRRGFLKAFGIGTAVAAAGGLALLEQELWTPKRTFFLPPAGGWGSNQLVSMQTITAEMLGVLSHQLMVGDIISFGEDPQLYQVAKPTVITHSKVNIRRPARYQGLFA